MKDGVSIRLSVTVSDGSFEGSLTMPVNASKQQINQIVEGWLKMFQAAVDSCVPDARQ